MSFIEGNAWYWISEQRVNWTSAFFYNGDGDLYFGTANNKSNGMYWQVYELPNERFQFRSRNSNTRKQLGVCYDSAEISSSRTQPCMEESSSDESQQWTINEWGDGSYKIQNVANGTDLNLDWHPGGPGFMSPDTAIAPIQPAQHWIFSSIGQVQDGLYSTSIVPSSTSSTGTAAATGGPATTSADATTTAAGSSQTGTDTPTPQESSSSGISGLSTGASAGIGVGVALGVIALIALVFFLIRRKKQRQPKDELQELPGASSGAYAGIAVPGKSYEKVGPIHEAPANQPTYEMDTTPTELPGGYEHRK